MRRVDSSPSIDQIAYAAVGLFVLVITWNGFRLAGGAVANAFMVLAFLAFLALVLVAHRPVPLPPWLLVAAGLFAVAQLVNVIFPPDSALLNEALIHHRVLPQGEAPGFLPPLSDFDFAQLATLEIAFLIIPVMIATVATTAQRIERLLDLLVISATVNAVVACIGFAGIDLPPIGGEPGREAGLTLHPNYLALTCTIAIPLALLWVARGGRWGKYGLLSTALLLAGTYVSGSRAGTVSALVAIAVTVALVPRLRRAAGAVVPVIGMVLISIVIFTDAGQEALEQVRLTGVDTSGSDYSRERARDVALGQIEARPVQGVGFAVIGDAHNIYLQLLASGGVIALTGFLVFIGGLWSSARRARFGPQPDAVVAVSVSIGMWLLNGIFDNQVADKYLYVVPGLLIAMSCVAAASARAPAPSPRAPGGPAPRPRGRGGRIAGHGLRLLRPDDAAQWSPQVGARTAAPRARGARRRAGGRRADGRQAGDLQRLAGSVEIRRLRGSWARRATPRSAPGVGRPSRARRTSSPGTPGS